MGGVIHIEFSNGIEQQLVFNQIVEQDAELKKWFDDKRNSLSV